MPLLNASDIVPLSHCPRRFWYDRNQPPGLTEGDPDPFEALIMELGLDHEETVKNKLSAKHDLVEAESVEHTKALMEDGVDVIYQAQLLDRKNQLFGKPDFLLHQEDGTYQAADAKLAQSINSKIGIQLAFYRRLLGSKHDGLVYLGTGLTETVGDKYNVKLDRYIDTAHTILLATERPEAHYGETKCASCPYYNICQPEFVEAEDPSLLYGVDGRSLAGLRDAGLETISQLAKADSKDIPDIPHLKGARKEKAVLQAKAWKTGALTKLNEIILPEGTWVHFDIEANPQTGGGHQHVYLWGFLLPPYAKSDFDYVWTDSIEEDKAGWLAFLAKVETYRERWPDLKLIHFANYERDQIKTYAKKYEMTENQTVTWLLGSDGPLYDIQKAIKANLVLPVSGYGLKNICKHPDLVNFQWEDDGSGSQWSVVQFINFLNASDPSEKEALKNSILTYNRDDVRATRALEEWLRRL